MNRHKKKRVGKMTNFGILFYPETRTDAVYDLLRNKTLLETLNEIYELIEGCEGNGSGGISEIPQATESILGGIKAAPRTDNETSEVKIDPETGKLYSVLGGIDLEEIVEGYWIDLSGVKHDMTIENSPIEGTTFGKTEPTWAKNCVEVRLPSYIKRLEHPSFQNATNLKILILGKEITHIGPNIFINNPNIRECHIHTLVPPSIALLPNLPEEFQWRVPVESFYSYRNNYEWMLVGGYNQSFLLLGTRPGSRVHSGYTVLNLNMTFNSSDIIIEGINFINPSNITGDNAALTVRRANNVIIRNCKFTDIPIMKAIYLLECHYVIIYNCDFDRVSSGIKASKCYNVQIFSNDFKNITGDISGAEDSGYAIQFEECAGLNSVIQDNAIDNELWLSSTEDSINIYKCNFNLNYPLRIRNNWIRGGGPSESSGGIIIGDNPGFVGGGQIAEDNVLSNTGQCGIAIVGGSNMTLLRNIVYGYDLMQLRPWANVGLIGINRDHGNTTSTNITIRENKVLWNKSDYTLNNYLIDASVEPVNGISTNSWGDDGFWDYFNNWIQKDSEDRRWILDEYTPLTGK